MHADVRMDVRRQSYDMKLDAGTEGFIGTLFPWRATIRTNGGTQGGHFRPRSYTEHSTWKDGLKVTEMRYDAQGRAIKMVTKVDDGRAEEQAVDDVLARNAVDLLTGALVMLQSVKVKGRCAGSFPIFDGKRRYNITLTDAGEEMVTPSQYSSFRGLARRCTLRVDPVAGFKKKDEKRGWLAVQNHTEARHMLPTLWLARARGAATAIPVRMEIASAYGSVVAHLMDGGVP